MKQSILKHGDLVRYRGMNPDMGRLGFASGSNYEVKARQNGALYVQSSSGMQVDVVTANNELTYVADYVTKVQCPLVLPRGLANG